MLKLFRGLQVASLEKTEPTLLDLFHSIFKTLHLTWMEESRCLYAILIDFDIDMEHLSHL